MTIFVTDGATDASTRCAQGRMEIDTAALQANLRELRKQAGPGRKVMAVVKADGYGHGAVGVAKALAGQPVDYFAAGSVAEGVAVRAVAPGTPIVILGGFRPAECRDILDHDLIASIDTREAGTSLSEAAGDRSATVFIKVDGGFGRFGVPLEATPAFVRWAAGLSGLQLGGIYTHLPFSDAAGQAWAMRRGQAFAAVIDALRAEGIEIPVVQSVASPGIAATLPDRGNAIAAGHLLYGMAPLAAGMPDDTAAACRPALRSISTTLIHIGRRTPGDGAALYLRSIGPDARLGVMPVGISHGYRPTAPDAHVLIGNRRVPVLRPCLENTVLDISGVPHAAVGDAITLVGRTDGAGISLADLAGWHASSPLAVLTALGRSLTRR